MRCARWRCGHHYGPLHFAPYKSLGTVRNNSRDWVVGKFNLPPPVDVDSKTVRKLIEKVGQAMLRDEEVTAAAQSMARR